jgi:hypothetical protein
MTWEKPRIIDVETLPAALGGCVGGQSVVGASCENGSNADGGGNCASGISANTAVGTVCDNGNTAGGGAGVPGNCQNGTTVT